MELRRIGVAGSGAMGSGIAQISAQSGYEVVLYDIADQAVEKANKVISTQFAKMVEKGKLTESNKAEILERLTFTTDLTAISDCDLIIEAIVEKLEIKLELFGKLEEICKSDAILTSNTSTMSITKLATGAKRPDKTAGLHFFNPAPVMKLVEVIRGYYTSDETVEALTQFVRSIGKESVIVKKDTPGFLVNRLMLLQFREAQLMYEEGLATLEDIDKAMVLGLNHPMGPFTLMDFAGVDITYDSLAYLHQEFGQPHWAPTDSLKRLIRAGRSGKKAGKGWYDYE
jgi:3-hydroxybutyryl-CoA dehydrogenase